jgi:hypothetical protein
MKIYIISKLVKNCYKKEEEPKLLLTQQKKRKPKNLYSYILLKPESWGFLLSLL